MNTDSEDHLIQYFEALLLEKEKQELQLSQGKSRQLLFVFCKNDLKNQLEQYFPHGTKFAIFKRYQKYLILKVINNQNALFQNGRLGPINCVIKPTYHFRTQILESFQYDNSNNYSVFNQDETVYLLGREVDTPEGPLLEYKSYKAEFMINNSEQLIKAICAMINIQEEQEGCILIGIAYDKDMQNHVVAGCYCSDRINQKVLAVLNERCNEFPVQIKARRCGTLLDGVCQIVSNLRIYEVKVKSKGKLVTNTMGKYFRRENNQSVPIGLRDLYSLLKEQLIEEQAFVQCLTQQDNLNQQLITKKRSSNQKQQQQQ